MNMLDHATDDTTTVIQILAHRLSEARTQLEKLQKKARKYGNNDISFSFGPEYLTERVASDGRKFKVAVHDLTIENGQVRFGNHEFVAKIDLHTASVPLIDTVPGASVPERFRTTDAHCDHCNKIRSRNEVFVVRDTDSGDYLQIGRSCLKDYMGIDPAAASWKFAWITETRDLSDEFGFGGFSWSETMHGILTATSAVIRLYGWLPKSHPDVQNSVAASTAERVAVLWTHRPNQHEREEIAKITAAISDADRQIADATIEFVRNELKGDSEYVWNLKALLADDVLYDRKRLGIVVSAVSAYQRHLGTLARVATQREKNKASVFVGTVGERLKGLKLTVTGAKSIASAYGDCILYKFTDADGNLFSWFASGSADLNVGETYTLDATVKAHKEFNGIQETNITRGKVK